MIEIKNIYKNYDENQVIKNLSLKLENGTIFGLIGINGAGKSTLLKMVMGIIKPSQGVINIDKQSVFDHVEAKKKLFYLSDQPPFNHQMSFKDLADLYKVFYPFDNHLFESILNQFGLNVNQNLSQISKGMKRQGYIALAFASGAKYLLLDEVFDGLDPAARLKFKKLMISEDHKDKIMIITSHSLRELEDICDTFGLIDDGHFKHYGNIDTEVHKLIKYQIILNDINPITLNKKPQYYQQDGRILTLVIETTDDINLYIDESLYRIKDELPLSFEEYFMVHQGGQS